LPHYFGPDGFFGGNNLPCYLAYRKAFLDIFLMEETFIPPSLRLKKLKRINNFQWRTSYFGL